MARFDRAIATAQKLIKKNGQVVKWRKTTAPIPDTAKPWLNGEPTVVDADCVICFLPINKEMREMLMFIRGTEVLGGSVAGLMGAVGFTPNPIDSVVRDGVTYSINNIDILAPNGQVVLYTIEFKS